MPDFPAFSAPMSGNPTTVTIGKSDSDQPVWGSHIPAHARREPPNAGAKLALALPSHPRAREGAEVGKFADLAAAGSPTRGEAVVQRVHC